MNLGEFHAGLVKVRRQIEMAVEDANEGDKESARDHARIALERLKDLHSQTWRE